MKIVTLTSDLGLKDYYASLLKGAILCKDSNLNIVDISHNVKPYDIVQGAFVLKNAFRHFPKGTIHIACINQFSGNPTDYIAFQKEGHYFIGPNDGIFSLLFEELPEFSFKLGLKSAGLLSIQEVVAAAVGHIAAGKPLAEIGMPNKTILERISLQPVISPSQIRGAVIHIDHYENAVLNIDKTLFERVAAKRAFELYFKRFDPITRLSQHYSDVVVGEVLCLFNSANYLEIAVNMGRASTLLGLEVDDNVQIDFHFAEAENN